MLPIAKVGSRLQSKEIGLGIIAASGMVLVAALLLALWGLSRSSDSAPQPGTVIFQGSVTPAPTNEATLTALPQPTPTLSPTSTATASASPTSTIIPLPSHIPTVIPSPTASVTIVPSAIPTLTSTPSPTPTETPPPTPTPPPTSIPIPTSTPTSTPMPVPDDHYAVVMHSADPILQQWFLDTLDTKWFLDWMNDVDEVPVGHEELITILSLPGPSPQRIQEIADISPGSVWYVVGEPNRRDGYGASDIVTQLHDLYTAIKTADPTARITSPSVLNWEFTCIGCAGYQNGSEWLDEFRSAYVAQYGEEPPIDIWAIDIYPLDWWNLPTVDHQLVIDQVAGLRQYLDAAGLQDDPIWITELGLHWGYPEMDWTVEECNVNGSQLPSPAGMYQTEQVIGYLDAIFDWLDANAASKNIEKWFLLSTYDNIITCNSGYYAGLTLFDGPNVGASLTAVGQFFRDRVLGISP